MKCALCEQEEELRVSHIIPKFAYDYLKETSFTKRILTATKPNIPFQDGTKYKTLCAKCENNFSIYENTFCRRIFKPYHHASNLASLRYGEWLTKFIIFTHWKILYCHLRGITGAKQTGLSLKEKRLLEKTEYRWRQYLLGSIRSPKNLLNCIFFGSYISDCNGFNDLPKGLNRYLGRAIDATLVQDQQRKELWIYSKLVKIIMVSIIKGECLVDWQDTKIELSEGNIKIPQKVSSRIGYFLLNRVEQVNKRIEQRSERQRQKVLEKQLEDPSRFINSETGKSLFEDMKLQQLIKRKL